MSQERLIELYDAKPKEAGRGTFFYTDCGNRMYSVNNDPLTYHGKLCPKCFWRNKYVTLYMRGTKEADEYLNSLEKENG